MLSTSKKIAFVCCGLLLCSTILTAILFAFIYEKWISRETGTYSCVSDACLQVASDVLGRMNYAVEPCDDFYEFACGRYARNAVPWNSPQGMRIYGDIVDAVQADLYSILSPAPSAEEDNDTASGTEALSTFVRSCEKDMKSNKPSSIAVRFIKNMLDTSHTSCVWQEMLPNSTDILIQLQRFGLPLLLNFAVRGTYNGLPCLAENDSEDSRGRFLCIDVVSPVFRLKMRNESNFVQIARNFTSRVTECNNTSFKGIENVYKLHSKLSRVYSESSYLMHSPAEDEVSYFLINLNDENAKVPRFYAPLIKHLNELTNTSSSAVYIRNRNLLNKIGDVLDDEDLSVVTVYAMLESFIRLMLLLGDSDEIFELNKSAAISVLDPRILATLSTVSMSGKTKELRVPQSCLQLAYTVHRPYFKAIYKLRYPDSGSGSNYDDVVNQIKRVFIDNLSQSSWMTSEIRRTLSSVISAMPLEVTPYENVDFSTMSSENGSIYGSDFVTNMGVALTNSVRLDNQGWTSLGTITEHLHTFALFRQYFRDGIMWRHLSVDLYPDYVRYARVGYLAAYELADILESHPLSIFSALDRIFTLSLEHELDYSYRRKRLIKLYRRLAMKHLPKVYSHGETNLSTLKYRPYTYARDAVANSLAIYLTHQAFKRSQIEALGRGDESNNETSFITDGRRVWRLLNLDSYSDEKKFYLVMAQMWCERMTSTQFRRTFYETFEIASAEKPVAGLSGFSGTGLSLTQPGPLTTAMMTTINNAFSIVFSCPVTDYGDTGILSRI